MRILLVCAGLAVWLFFANNRATSQTAVPSTHVLTYLIQYAPFADGFAQPVGIVSAGDSRLFILERAGIIWIVGPNGERYDEPFLDIRDRVYDASAEQGLLGLVFHPLYPQNGLFYVSYTANDSASTISRFHVSAGNPNTADPASEAIVLVQPQPSGTHNAGDLHFGPDGYLYASIGEGGGLQSLPNAQDGSNLLGKIVRLDVDSAFPYAIPPDNPFVTDPAIRDEIWLMGLRNAWRFSFDSLTGDLFIGDVGGAYVEEVNYLAAGASAGLNFGWPCREGDQPYRPEYCQPGATLTGPIASYDNPAEGCAIVGGFVYHGTEYPQMAGDYLLGDACLGKIWRLRRGADEMWVRQFVGGGMRPISSLGADSAGELYAADFVRGEVVRLLVVPALPHFLPIAVFAD